LVEPVAVIGEGIACEARIATTGWLVVAVAPSACCVDLTVIVAVLVVDAATEFTDAARRAGIGLALGIRRAVGSRCVLAGFADFQGVREDIILHPIVDA